MAQDQPKSSWIKTILGTVAGLMSGGAVMYISPLVDKVMKPSRPMANFSVEANGLQVTVHNRSSGGEGWMDYGDGSALEPADPTAPTLVHTYAKPGNYNVKMMLRNYLGDENERSVPIEVSGSSVAAAPKILDLQAVSVSPQPIAPATFRLVGKAANAELALWDIGEKLEIVRDSPNQQERLVTFDSPGKHTVHFAVLNGTVTEKRSVAVDVKPAPTNSLLAVLRVQDTGTRVERKTITENLPVIPGDKPQSLDRTIAIPQGYQVIEAKLVGKSVEGTLKLQVDALPDKSGVRVRGDVLPATMKPGQRKPAVLSVPIQVVMERKLADKRPIAENSFALNFPGTTVLPLSTIPTDWVNPQRQMTMNLRVGSTPVLNNAAIPSQTMLNFGGKPFVFSAVKQGDQVRITVEEARSAATPRN